MLDSRFTDEDADQAKGALFDPDDDEQEEGLEETGRAWTAADFEAWAAQIYAEYEGRYRRRFKWLRADLFKSSLESELQSDADALQAILTDYGAWDPAKDAKLDALHSLLTETFPKRKALVFSQFADTVDYLEAQLKKRGVADMSGVTGSSADPTQLAWRFSPDSNQRPGQGKPERELRVLVATDVLSEGQNLQDSHVVVNYDLPWAIIRLIQRAGRVDRIGQKAEEILLPLLSASRGRRAHHRPAGASPDPAPPERRGGRRGRGILRGRRRRPGHRQPVPRARRHP